MLTGAGQANQRRREDHRIDECGPQCEQTTEASPPDAAPVPLSAQEVLINQSRELRRKARALEALAAALPSGFRDLSPDANDVLVASLLREFHRSYA